LWYHNHRCWKNPTHELLGTCSPLMGWLW
jgi:hypothetical protein